jgi:hypothetical protein
MKPLTFLHRLSSSLSSLGALAVRLPQLAYRTWRWRAYYGGWLPGYLRHHRPFDARRLGDGPIDVIVLVSDHYEPARRFGEAAATESVRSWCAAYEELAERHRDADGRPPQHTWFYRYDYPNPGCVQALAESTFRGFGEVEFHLHHGFDTHASFAATLREGLDWFNRFGAMLTAEPKPRRLFGYVAGNWALDNGDGDVSLSGCDTELWALRDAGCYADFTFPAFSSHAQPRKSNAVYYATDDPGPKSYDTGVDVAVGREPSGDLMIFEGPLVIDWRYGRFDDAAIETFAPPHPRRLDAWLSGNVHVPGRPEWVFVKLHTHAMQSRDAFLGPEMDALFEEMSKVWNRPPFRLHYATAREAYNLVKAAEAGHSGDPDDYRDFLIPPPANRRILCSRPWRLLSYAPERLHLEVLENAPARLEFAEGPLCCVSGQVRELEARFHNEEVTSLRIEGEGPFEVEPARYAPLIRSKGSLDRAMCGLTSGREGWAKEVKE